MNAFTRIRINEACTLQHEMMVEKGFQQHSIPEALMLIVSELSEALEADRIGKHANLKGFDSDIPTYYEFNGERRFIEGSGVDIQLQCIRAFEVHIKDTFEDEIADAFLRLMDLCGNLGIDIERHIGLKASYNTIRPYRNGKAY